MGGFSIVVFDYWRVMVNVSTFRRYTHTNSKESLLGVKLKYHTQFGDLYFWVGNDPQRVCLKCLNG